ncbi:phosphatase PAP2 family protein [Methylovorus menthalis]|uniref:phosphatase PAP2 family protein n=1 Tax=Methylovorus menthalis TaxID=1002227 RepID=UPI001E633FE5|nr:phosphatase PAP2 family protein [Methylovorus menthalis]MCB4810825.1 phosphatase PAP2 family protein [Methylovorus menthalis]
MNTWWMHIATYAAEYYVVGLVALWLIVPLAYRAHFSRADSEKRWLITSLLLMSMAGGVFCGIAYLLETGSLIQPDAEFSETVRKHASPVAMQYFRLVTNLGNTSTLTVICVLVVLLMLWLRQFKLAVGSLLAIGGNGLINVSLKDIFERLRPINPYGAPVDSWSFPSGHSSGSLVTYGLLAYLVMRLLPSRYHLPALLLGSSLAFTIASSRVFLHYHYASDVLAGLMSGLLWLTFCIALLEYTTTFPPQQQPSPDKG